MQVILNHYFNIYYMIFTFKDFTNKLKEHAVYDLDLSEFDNYLLDINDSIKTLKNFDDEINRLKDLLTQIDIDDIYINGAKYKDGENFELDFSLKTNALIDSIKEYYKQIKKNNEYVYFKINLDYFDGEELNLNFDIEIEKDRYNKFHFPINLPKFLKNIGLGKKIVLKTINTLKYCLFTKIDDSNDLKFVVASIRNKNHDYFTFEKDSNILIFDDDFKTISETLPDWINNYSDYIVLDKDFYKKYKNDITQNTYLNELYEKFLNKHNILF